MKKMIRFGDLDIFDIALIFYGILCVIIIPLYLWFYNISLSPFASSNLFIAKMFGLISLAVYGGFYLFEKII